MLSFGIFSAGSLDTYDLINRALIYVPLLLVSLSLHEFGHAAAAYALGDPTPKAQGRVTLNPLAHLDPFGTLMILFGPIGWGKPVQFNPNNIRMRNGEALVSLAGPAMNVLLALASAAVLKYFNFGPGYEAAVGVIQILFGLNISLAVFNLLPIPPLDGGHIWTAILPRALRPAYYNVLPYGIIFLLFLVLWPGANHGLSTLIGTIANWVYYHLLP